MQRNNQPPAKASSKLKDIPPEFVIHLDGTPFIKLGGLLYLASQMGVFKCETKDISTHDREIIFECRGWIIPSKEYLESKGISDDSPLIEMFMKPVVAHGTTNQFNLATHMNKFSYVMAETRSVARCLRILTECPYCSEEELEAFKYDTQEVIKIANEAGGRITSASDLLKKKPVEPNTRKDLIRAITDFEMPPEKKDDMKAHIKGFFDSHGANVMENLSNVLLKDLYNSLVQMAVE